LKDRFQLYGQQYLLNPKLERTFAMETLRDKLISIIKTLPEDRLQLIMDFINQMNQSNYQPEDFDELQMELEQ